MKKLFGLLLLIGVLFWGSACKSEFEKVRSSNNAEVIINKAFELYEKKDYQRAQTLFDLVLSSLRGDNRAEKAYYYYAYTHFYLKQYLLAAYYFKTFANTYTNSPFREEAAYMSAYSNFKLSPSYRLDQTNTRTAIEEFQLFTNLFPKSSRIDECNKLIDIMRRKLEEKAFAEGQLYYNLRQYQSAVISFDNLLRDYPESPDAERVRYLVARADYLLSENSIVEKREARYQETIKRCEEFLQKYPKGKYSENIIDLKKNAEAKAKAVNLRLKAT
ncbi:MAG: outer membrane protein assembly factor BamD [Bacteroidetes bacterium]|nr:outer membrane protein assembly factor BamD [Bacteroidota bacterium]